MGADNRMFMASIACLRARPLIVGLALLAWVPPCFTESVGGWAPVVGLNVVDRKRLLDVRRSRCLPRSDEVAVPVYPQAGIFGLDWGRMRPRCAARSGWADLGAIRMVSADDLSTVTAWYAERLIDHRQYQGDQGLLFIAADIDQFLWARDYHKYPNVAIKPAQAEWQKAGYKTVIELNRPAPP